RRPGRLDDDVGPWRQLRNNAAPDLVRLVPEQFVELDPQHLDIGVEALRELLERGLVLDARQLDDGRERLLRLALPSLSFLPIALPALFLALLALGPTLLLTYPTLGFTVVVALGGVALLLGLILAPAQLAAIFARLLLDCLDGDLDHHLEGRL